MVVPAGFVDRNPWRGPWRSANVPPEPYSWSIEVLMPSGETTHAVWSGKFWLGLGPTQPIGWRRVEGLGLGGYAAPLVDGFAPPAPTQGMGQAERQTLQTQYEPPAHLR